jgi:hypothetical protein
MKARVAETSDSPIIADVAMLATKIILSTGKLN